jgi:ABC-2 type transport system permease protein
MSAAGAILARELRVAWCSPLAWTLAAALTALGAWSFLAALEAYASASERLAREAGAPGITDLVLLPHYANLIGLMVFVMPLVTARSVVEERRAQTLPLLFAAGATDSAILLGKYGAIVLIAAFALAPATLMPLLLGFGTDLDQGRVMTALLALVLSVLALAALGVLTSAWAHHPATAALGALALGIGLWIVDAAARQQGVTDAAINWLALPSHTQALMRGVVASVDLAYFVLLALLALALALQRLGMLRREH